MPATSSPYFPKTADPFDDIDFGFTDGPDPISELGINVNPKKLAK